MNEPRGFRSKTQTLARSRPRNESVSAAQAVWFLDFERRPSRSLERDLASRRSLGLVIGTLGAYAVLAAFPVEVLAQAFLPYSTHSPIETCMLPLDPSNPIEVEVSETVGFHNLSFVPLMLPVTCAFPSVNGALVPSSLWMIAARLRGNAVGVAAQGRVCFSDRFSMDGTGWSCAGWVSTTGTTPTWVFMPKPSGSWTSTALMFVSANLPWRVGLNGGLLKSIMLWN